jgi:hypothetical protein
LAAAVTRSGRTPIYGPEPWRTKRNAVWSHWDLWFCVVTLADHDGDLDALAAAIEDRSGSLGSGTVEAKLSHLDDLTRRLAEAGIDAAKLAGDADADPGVRGKARTKVLKQGLYPRDLTDAMRHPPRDRLYERALRGRWKLFPVSPEPFYERLANGLGDGYLSKGQTFALERRIEAARERLDRNTAKDPAARLAARRALLTFCYRAMERCDDSYGLIGELAQEALFTYARLAFAPAGIAAEDWCEDLCELLVWEDWGLLHRHETRPFAQVNGPLADHAERFLLALADELRGHRLRHQADQALANIAYLHIAAGRLTSFAPAAAKLGSDRWMPIVALAQAAITRSRHDIAREVFAAADQPGLQRDYLHERCTELTGTPPAAASGLTYRTLGNARHSETPC